MEYHVQPVGQFKPERSMSLLVSSMSARGKALTIGRELVDILRAGGWDVTVHVTNSTSDVREEAASSDHPFVGALGGDGYLTAAARGCVGGQYPLLPFPGGRGNDLCRSLGIGSDAIKWAWKLAEASTEEVQSWIRPLDAMQVSSRDGEFIVLGIVSAGIDATANHLANRSWFRSGSLAYAYGASLAALGKYRKLDISGEIFGVVPDEFGGSAHNLGVFSPDLGGWLTSISNTGWFGGGVNILPESKTDDGMLEIIAVEGIPRLRAIIKLARVLTSRQLDDPVVHVYRGTRISLNEPQGLAVMADGDVVGHLPIEVRVLPSALKVVAPKEDA